VKETDNSSDCSECDEGDEVAAEEADDFFDASAPVMDTENVDQFRFDPHLWKINELPVQPTVEFLGVSGPLHQLSSTSGPFEFFCLFIPIFWWDRWATYTNQKATMEDSAGKKKRFWLPTCATSPFLLVKMGKSSTG